MKLLSFAIPCYNSKDYMEHCIESILPGGDDVEIIIVDDGSKDETAAIADRYAAEYPDIVKAVHQENGGHGEAVNTGLKNATGKYFKVVDSDDWVMALIALGSAPFLLLLSRNLPEFPYSRMGGNNQAIRNHSIILLPDDGWTGSIHCQRI